MTLDDFRESLSHDVPPRQLETALVALWWDGKGDWKQAHEIAGQDEGPAAAWVHAYLHRKEGDASNAGYWYSRADKLPTKAPLAEEWSSIAESLLAGSEPEH
jgi:hypothetical protein